MYDKLIIIPPCNTYGDVMSIIALMYYFRNFYKETILYLVDTIPQIIRYYQSFFEKDPEFHSHKFIFTNKQIETLIHNNLYDTYHICCLHTGDWSNSAGRFVFYDHEKINKLHYFCDYNPIYNFLTIDHHEIEKPHKALPLTNVEINSIVYYKNIGLNNNVRMNYFQYFRNREKEREIKQMILQSYHVKETDKYNIINTIGSQGEFIDKDRIKKQIKNNYPCIDINYATDFTGWLCLLLEDCEELHLVEGVNVNFIYYCQFKNIINIHEKQVYLHNWARNRDWPQYKLDYSWKMMSQPKLENWTIVFDECK